MGKGKGKEVFPIRAKLTTPLLFRSKLLCFSFLYLSLSLILSLLYSSSLSPARCLSFLSVSLSSSSSPFLPLPDDNPLFPYPPSYGQHKYSLPSRLPSSSCSSVLEFSEYGEAARDIGELCRNMTLADRGRLRYMEGKGVSFGGNVSFGRRLSYFDRSRGGVAEIPCGFFKEFPISDNNRKAMERCDGVVVVSAILNDHDKNLISLNSKEYTIGVWRIVRVSTEELYESPAMNGVIPKYLVHRLFPNTKLSVWIDAKLQLLVDPLLLLHSLVLREGADMAISRHPFYIHTMEEAVATARWKKWDVKSVREQMESYCENGLRPWSSNKHPYPSDVPDSALILRRHTAATNHFSCLLFNELEGFNPRDQLAFAFVRDRMNPKLRLNMFDEEVFEQVTMEFRHNLKRVDSTSQGKGKGQRRTGGRSHSYGDVFVNDTCCSRCRGYLSVMWG
ncbi:hypothetical protein MLD38_010113 [Melastoma candidum]|uniref:Uncharacterized protein n=1 Tax=Melastoma candidum TaxID=119954 RepID=A0ACB9R2V6_9MYRT|nr:hypothetical protein MLD38_010113 [Melastoma candidum]